MLAAILQTAGFKTGLYTSPHLHDFRERIKVNGVMVSQDFVISFTKKVQPLIDEIEPSFFEITVAMAFEYFAEKNVDIAIIEVGLGGRLDSTNIISPEVAVITNIGLDHMNILGNSIQEIASEKAGIIKEGIPVVIGEVLPETKDIFLSTAQDKNAEITIAEEKWMVGEWALVENQLVIDAGRKSHQDHQHYRLDLTGFYQVRNLVTTLETIAALRNRGWLIDEDDVKKGLQQVVGLTGFKGRWQVAEQNPLTVLDVAHNEDGIRQLLKQVELTDHTGLHIVLGLVKHKEIDAILKLLPENANYYFTQAHIPRALDAALLKSKANAFGLKGESYEDVNTAIKSARSHANKDDLVIVCGSVFLVGEVALS
jgi:dihydrofolate synthase/folylpolyglutamate synthase